MGLRGWIVYNPHLPKNRFFYQKKKKNKLCLISLGVILLLVAKSHTGCGKSYFSNTEPRINYKTNNERIFLKCKEVFKLWVGFKFQAPPQNSYKICNFIYIVYVQLIQSKLPSICSFRDSMMAAFPYYKTKLAHFDMRIKKVFLNTFLRKLNVDFPSKKNGF